MTFSLQHHRNLLWLATLLFLYTITAQQPETKKAKKVNVTVFYEVLCPDSRHFILRQLFPTWQKVSDIMEVDYRPFGKATYKKRPGGGYKFSCQHGPTECLGNIVHNCVVKYIKEPLPYIRCMMEDNYEPLDIGKKCAYQLDIDWEPISKCAQGREGEELMAVVAQESLGVKHKLSFIPTVALDGDYSNQNNILKNFLPVLCNKYKGERPQNCVQVI